MSEGRTFKTMAEVQAALAGATSEDERAAVRRDAMKSYDSGQIAPKLDVKLTGDWSHTTAAMRRVAGEVADAGLVRSRALLAVAMSTDEFAAALEAAARKMKAGE